MKNAMLLLGCAMAIFVLPTVTGLGWPFSQSPGLNNNLLTSLSTRIAELEQRIRQLLLRVSALLTNIPLVTAACPTSATGGQVLGIRCYTVATTPTSFTVAQSSCLAQGGTLAQPLPLSTQSASFYAMLKAKFATQFATIEATNPNAIWIGYLQTTVGSPFYAQDGNGVNVLLTNPIFSPSVSSSGATSPQAAAIVTPTGSTWTANVPSTLHPYICQYNLV